jgi:hypothetical protein
MQSRNALSLRNLWWELLAVNSHSPDGISKSALPLLYRLQMPWIAAPLPSGLELRNTLTDENVVSISSVSNCPSAVRRLIVIALRLIPWLQRVSYGVLYGRAGPTRYAGPRDSASRGRGAGDLTDTWNEAERDSRGGLTGRIHEPPRILQRVAVRADPPI